MSSKPRFRLTPCLRTGMPEDNASTSIQRKLGFEQIGETTNDDIGRPWQWLRRSEMDRGRDGGRGWD